MGRDEDEGRETEHAEHVPQCCTDHRVPSFPADAETDDCAHELIRQQEREDVSHCQNTSFRSSVDQRRLNDCGSV